MKLSVIFLFFLSIAVLAGLLYAFDTPTYDVYLKEADSVYKDDETGRFIAPLIIRNTSNQIIDCELKASTEVEYVIEKTGFFDVDLEPNKEQSIKIVFNQQPREGKIEFNFGLTCPLKLVRHYTKKIELNTPASVFFEARFPQEVYGGSDFDVNINLSNNGNNLIDFEVIAEELNSEKLIQFSSVPKLDVFRTGENYSVNIPARSLNGVEGISKVKVSIYSNGIEIISEFFDIGVVNR